MARKRALSNAPTIGGPQPRPVPVDTGVRRLPGAMEVPLEQLAPDPEQPRRDWSHDDGEARLEELAASIREFGVLQPLLVREAGALEDGRQRYAIIAGGRRYAAAQRAGLAALPVVVRGEEPARVRILQLLENLQRQDLAPLDEARAFQELMDLERLSPPAVAERLHMSAQHVRERLRLLADQILADAVERRQISATAAREIMKLPDEEMHAFRERVSRGETLQTNDVATARARLQAAGAAHERRKGPPRASQVVQPAHAAPDISPTRQTSFVDDRKDAGAAPVPNGHAAPGLAAPPAPDRPAAAEAPRPQEPEARVRALLGRCLPEDRVLFVQVLAIAAEQGWTCAELARLLDAG